MRSMLISNAPCRRIATRRLAAVALATSLLSLVGCKVDTLVVGAVLPLSGPNQALGDEAQRGLELAADEWRAAGNDRLELIVVDGAGDPVQAADQLRALYEERHAVAAVAAGGSLESRALVEVADQAERILMLSSAEDQELGAASPQVYRMSLSLLSEGTKMATFASRKLAADKAALVAQDERFAGSLESGFGSSFTNAGGEYLGSRVTPELDRDTVADLRKQQCDVVALAGEGPWLAQTVVTLRGAGFKGSILAPQSFATPGNLAQLGKDAKGVIFAYTHLEAGEAGSAFIEAFTAKYGSAPTIFAAEAYDTLNVLLKASNDRPAIASELRRGLRDEIKSYAGASGNIEFDETGAPKKFPALYSLDNKLALRDHEVLIDERIAARRAEIERIKIRLSSMGAGSR